MSTLSGNTPLFYRAEGKGPLVIMLHGLLMDGKSWSDNGFVAAFSPFFKVVCPDLPGHGKSEKSDDQACYTRDNQALAIVKLMDELGYEKAHVIGYSAGTWLAQGLLETYPERLNSVVSGGWDCLNGIPETPVGKLTFEMFIAFARETAPELTDPLSPAGERSAEHFFNALREPFGAKSNTSTCSTPELLWAGRHDLYYAAMVELAKKQAIPLITGEGDHLGEVNHPDNTTVAAILKFCKDHTRFESQ